MVFHPYKSPPQERRSSNPTWSSRVHSTNVFTPRTPCNGKKSNPKARGSPFMDPGTAMVTPRNGQSYRLKLYPPKAIAEKAVLRNGASSTNTPGRARLPGRKPNYLIFPPNSGVDAGDPSLTLVSPPMQGTPRRAEPLVRPKDRTRPTVQLLRVLNKCWDDDLDKDSSWAITDGLLNGRNDERDRSRMWGTLNYAVNKVWPELRGWIMHNKPFPSEYDEKWLNSAEGSDERGEGYIEDPLLATKDSSLDRLGFYSS
jgi:hypothetical protein